MYHIYEDGQGIVACDRQASREADPSPLMIRLILVAVALFRVRYWYGILERFCGAVDPVKLTPFSSPQNKIQAKN